MFGNERIHVTLTFKLRGKTLKVTWKSKMEKALKKHDSYLFIQETSLGRYDVYRKSQTGACPPHFIFSLTDTWTPRGVPVQYGYEVVLARLNAHDLWRDEDFVEKWIKYHDKYEESKDRDVRNNIESFLYDFRRQFARATDSVNTSNLQKVKQQY